MADRYPLKKHPIIGACGLYCGLCPRYYTDGPSRCPGCCGPDFWQKHPSCGLITCCVKQKKLETCAQCSDWTECEKVDKLLDFASRRDTALSYKPIAANFAFIQEHGIEEFISLLMEKQKLLTHLIENYNDGRSKSFYCTSCQLVPLDKLKEALQDAETEITQGTDIKEKAKVVRQAIGKVANDLRNSLKLRK